MNIQTENQKMSMDIEETIEAILKRMCDKLNCHDETVMLDTKRRLTLVCMTYLASNNDALLSYLPPVDLVPPTR